LNRNYVGLSCSNSLDCFLAR